ncbi:MAG: hypothetical protein V3V05_02965 [Pontiella sp.]
MNRKKQFTYGKFFRRSMILLGLSIGLASTAYSQSNTSNGMDDALKGKSVPKRDPFWPVGYVPEVRIKVDNEQNIVIPVVNNNWKEAMKKVVINGVSSRGDNEFFAVINGQVKSVGESVTLNHEGTVYTWAVDSITPPGSVKLRRVSAQ